MESELFEIFVDVALSKVTHKLKLFSHFLLVNAKIFATIKIYPLLKDFAVKVLTDWSSEGADCLRRKGCTSETTSREKLY